MRSAASGFVFKVSPNLHDMVIKTLPGAAASRSFHPGYFLSVHPLNAAAWLAIDGGARQRHLLVSAGDLCFGWGLIAGDEGHLLDGLPLGTGRSFLPTAAAATGCETVSRACKDFGGNAQNCVECICMWKVAVCPFCAHGSRAGPTSVLLPHRASYVSCWTAPLISHCCAYHDGTWGGTASCALPTFMPLWC
jgi:hypothetical protein